MRAVPLVAVVFVVSLAVAAPPRAPVGDRPHVQVSLAPTMWLVSPMSEIEFAGYEERLNLSEAQSRIARDLIRRYRDDLGEIEREFMPGLRERGTELAQEHHERGYTKRLADLTDQHVRDHHRLHLKVKELDAMLFSDLAMFLADEQIDIMPSIQASRQRSRYPIERTLRASVRGINVDLTRLIADMELPESVERTIRPLLDEYGFLIGPLLEARYQEMINRRARVTRFWSAYPTPGDEYFLSRRRQLHLPLVRIHERIRLCNLRYLDLLRNALPAPYGETLREKFDAEVHPLYYPDRDATNLKQFVIEIASRNDLQHEQHMMMGAIMDRYHSEYDRIRERLDRTVSAFEANFEATLALMATEKEAYEAEVKVILGERRELNLATKNAIMALLTPEQIAALGLGEGPK